MKTRINPIPELPSSMDPQLRRALTDIFQKQNIQINHTAHDSTSIASSQIVAADLVLVDATAGTVLCTLIPAVDWQDKFLRIKKMNSNTNTVLITGNASETIDEATTATISAQYRSYCLFSDGSNWLIV